MILKQIKPHVKSTDYNNHSITDTKIGNRSYKLANNEISFNLNQ